MTHVGNIGPVRLNYSTHLSLSLLSSICLCGSQIGSGRELTGSEVQKIVGQRCTL